MKRRRAKRVWFFPRASRGPDQPAGITVSKRPTLPTGDFQITEYIFAGSVALWFVDADNFTARERSAAFAYFTGRRVPA